MSFKVVEAARLRAHPQLGTHPLTHGNNGAFQIDSPFGNGWQLFIIASDGTEPGIPLEWSAWEHVSVHAHRQAPGTEFMGGKAKIEMRIPTWREMCHVKALHWDPEDVVVQFHPAEADYVNNHEACLHLWRWKGGAFPVPPSELVGIKAAGPLRNQPRLVHES